MLPDFPEAGSVSGAHQNAPGAADLPLSPLWKNVPFSVWTGNPPVLALLLPTTEHAQGNQHLQVNSVTFTCGAVAKKQHIMGTLETHRKHACMFQGPNCWFLFFLFKMFRLPTALLFRIFVWWLKNIFFGWPQVCEVSEQILYPGGSRTASTHSLTQLSLPTLSKGTEVHTRFKGAFLQQMIFIYMAHVKDSKYMFFKVGPWK